MKAIPNWLIIAGGIGQIFTAAIYPYIRHRVFDWYNDIKKLKPLNQEIAKTYRILLLLGDDLGDFLPGVRTSIEQRVTLVAPYLENWGRKWFLLPNPGYGSWEEALYAPKRAADPTDRVRQKERILLALRIREGLPAAWLDDKTDEVQRLLDEGLMERKADRLTLTRKGKLVADSVTEILI